jgi:hypothetical protein
MSKFKTEFYNASSGVVFTVAWDSEEEYLLGKAFLQKLVGGPAGRADLDQPDFYYFENDQQRDALYAFRKTLKARKREPGA